VIETNEQGAPTAPIAQRGERLDSLKIVVVGPPRATSENIAYLSTKRGRMGHLLDLEAETVGTVTNDRSGWLENLGYYVGEAIPKAISWVAPVLAVAGMAIAWVISQGLTAAWALWRLRVLMTTSTLPDEATPASPAAEVRV